MPTPEERRAERIRENRSDAFMAFIGLLCLLVALIGFGWAVASYIEAGLR